MAETVKEFYGHFAVVLLPSIKEHSVAGINFLSFFPPSHAHQNWDGEQN